MNYFASILFGVVLCLASCSSQEENKPEEQQNEGEELAKGLTIFSGNVMTIDYRLLVGGELSQNQQEEVVAIIRKTFDEINRVFNKWNPNSELSKINRIKAGDLFVLSKGLEEFLEAIDGLYVATGGRFDPTVEGLQGYWKRCSDEGIFPEVLCEQELMEATGWQTLHFGGGLLWKEFDKTELDLGGCAKGLAIDLLLKRVVAAGHPNTYVEWGGEIATAGRHPTGRKWAVAIAAPGHSAERFLRVEMPITGGAIASSGDQFQHWKAPGSHKEVSHIIDPLQKRLLPVAGRPTLLSITASSCCLADMLATAAMASGSFSEARAWSLHLLTIADSPPINIWLAKPEK